MKLRLFVVTAGPPTNVGIDFFVQSFGPMDEIAMVCDITLIPATVSAVPNYFTLKSVKSHDIFLGKNARLHGNFAST